MTLVLGVDSSTTACKVQVHDADTGALVASGRAPHPEANPPCSEQAPQAWRKAMEEACWAADVTHHPPSAAAVAGQQHGLVALDADGEVLRPAKLWNDTESAPDAGWLLKQLDGGAAAWAAACGSVPTAAFTISKLSWLHRSEPEAFDRMAAVLLPHDWLTFTLTGERVTDRGDASGTGYWSPFDGAYRWDLLTIVDQDKAWESCVPRVLGPADPAGEWRGRSGTIVAAGTGDNMAAALGLGLAPGDLAFSLGTSGTVFSVSGSPTADAGGAVAGFADATGRFLPLVCTLNATRVTNTFGRLLGVGPEELDRLALDAPPGAHGLTLVPYLDGERTPNRPTATGTLAGVRTATDRADVARAAFEGVVCGLLDGADALAAAGVDVSGRVLLVGGGAHSAAYRQVLADLCGREVIVPEVTEAVARGAAVQAAAVLHGRDPADVAGAWAPGVTTTVEPTPAVDAAAVRERYHTVTT